MGSADTDQDCKNQYQNEQQRIRFRRSSLNLAEADEESPRSNWALALSGGGIRSATFCLGVLQALSRARSPRAQNESADLPLLSEFDYLSTVSGGGYIGSFLYSLFLPDRLRACPGETQEAKAKEAAQNAYDVLRYEPPGRISSSALYQDEDIGKGPGAWLRENGRYLTPTGSGDMAYAVSMTWRNWLSLHFVIGMPVLLALSLLFLLKLSCLDNLFLLPAAAMLLGVLPCALAYWLVLPKEQLDDTPSLNNPAAHYTKGVLVVLILCAAAICLFNGAPLLALLSLAFASIATFALAIAQYWVNELKRLEGQEGGQSGVNSVRNYRVVVTRNLSKTLIAFAGLLFLAFLGTLAEEIYERLDNLATAGTLGVLPVLIWLVRKLALLKDEKTLPGWLTRLPLDALGLLGGALMLLVVCLAWALLVLWITSGGTDVLRQDGFQLRLLILVALSAGLIWVTHRFVGFLNTSTLQPFYASRLTRAYLGASNGKRFNGSDSERHKRMSVAEPLRDDDLSVADYFGPCTAGPVHLVNVTMNLTVDPSEQLVQRDRKGKPLCIAPGWSTNGALPMPGVILDGTPCGRAAAPLGQSEIFQPLSIGQWIGVSGAAISTGLGRTSSLGISLLLGLANIRLGVWWPGRLLEAGEYQWTSRDPWLVTKLPTQSYLFYELTAKFHGHRRDYQYLSDGGHFENTAAYELIRPERNVELIVVCDCGCDPTYQFDDLSNLVRLARIDHKVEIREDPGVLQNPILRQVFGSLAEFREPPADDNTRCAVLLNVVPCTGQAPQRRILVLKPRLIASLAPDVQNYARTNPDFPNQTTADQFFDEAQFESYRQLGLSIGSLLFGGDAGGTLVSKALWKYLGYP